MLRRIPVQSKTPHTFKPSVTSATYHWRFTSTQSRLQTTSTGQNHDVTTTTSPTQKSNPQPQGQQKTMAQLDEELRQKMWGIAGDGGEAGVEYEDGKPVAMKRSVKNNMFRYI
ncbi:hypothetical protein F4803DRAFT_497036 [Xylaria telfairii]|nr:hypothetical protein F4803DRAFT_497036 [Xylaria telfairii]